MIIQDYYGRSDLIYKVQKYDLYKCTLVNFKFLIPNGKWNIVQSIIFFIFIYIPMVNALYSNCMDWGSCLTYNKVWFGYNISNC